MKANEKPINYERPQDQYEAFELAIYEYFTAKARAAKCLYRSSASGEELWDLYLNNLPEEGRHFYNCRECRRFVERYGDLVVIDDNYRVESALWGADVPEFFKASVKAMYDYVWRGYVTGIFVSDKDVIGTPRTGIWSHLHVRVPSHAVNISRTKNADQIMADKREERGMLIRALQEYPVGVAEQAVSLLETDTMYRSNNVLGIAKWFAQVSKEFASRKSFQNNFIWKAVGEAPTGFCHIKSSMIGTLLDDIKAGYSTRLIIARFEEKMNPQNYMRSQSAPTAAAIEQAEKMVEKLGIADSLRRRYARLEEVAGAYLWRPRGPLYKFLENTEKKTGGVFSHLTPKDKPTSNDIPLVLPTTTMTWVKFSKTILPSVTKLEVLVDNPNRFVALVTEAVPGSENILKWDNPFSWYYHGGIDGEIKRRVESAGGQYENCAIRCSLMWNNYTDLDLHCVTPTGEKIYYGHKNSRDGGYLDVDANGGRATTQEPVENMRWTNHADNGHYRFWVHNYCNRDKNEFNPFKIELEVGGKIYSFENLLTYTDQSCAAFEFDYYNGEVRNFKSGAAVSESNAEVWGLTMNQFAEVTGIIDSPNMWNRIDDEHADNHHTFFLLKGCKDTSEGKGRGFFNEILKPELREIRKTLELYSANTPIEGVEESDACGVGFNKDTEWNLTLRVTSSDSSRFIKIDRFD